MRVSVSRVCRLSQDLPHWHIQSLTLTLTLIIVIAGLGLNALLTQFESHQLAARPENIPINTEWVGGSSHAQVLEVDLFSPLNVSIAAPRQALASSAKTDTQ